MTTGAIKGPNIIHVGYDLCQMNLPVIVLMKLNAPSGRGRNASVRGEDGRFRGRFGGNVIPSVDPQEVFNNEEESQCIQCSYRSVCV